MDEVSGKRKEKSLIAKLEEERDISCLFTSKKSNQKKSERTSRVSFNANGEAVKEVIVLINHSVLNAASKAMIY